MDIYGNRIFTKRLQLRKPEKEDIELLFTWSHSPEAYGKYLSPERLKLEHLQDQLASGALWNDREKLFLVELRDTGKPIGTTHYWQLPGNNETVIISLKIALPAERNKGYGTELQKFLIIQLFSHKKIKNIEMYTDINNNGQQRCLRKLGFELAKSLTYEDQQVQRTGYLFRLTAERYNSEPIYHYHYE